MTRTLAQRAGDIFCVAERVSGYGEHAPGGVAEERERIGDEERLDVPRRLAIEAPGLEQHRDDLAREDGEDARDREGHDGEAREGGAEALSEQRVPRGFVAERGVARHFGQRRGRLARPEEAHRQEINGLRVAECRASRRARGSSTRSVSTRPGKLE